MHPAVAPPSAVKPREYGYPRTVIDGVRGLARAAVLHLPEASAHAESQLTQRGYRAPVRGATWPQRGARRLSRPRVRSRLAASLAWWMWRHLCGLRRRPPGCTVALGDPADQGTGGFLQDLLPGSRSPRAARASRRRDDRLAMLISRHDSGIDIGSARDGWCVAQRLGHLSHHRRRCPLGHTLRDGRIGIGSNSDGRVLCRATATGEPANPDVLVIAFVRAPPRAAVPRREVRPRRVADRALPG